MLSRIPHSYTVRFAAPNQKREGGLSRHLKLCGRSQNSILTASGVHSSVRFCFSKRVRPAARARGAAEDAGCVAGTRGPKEQQAPASRPQSGDPDCTYIQLCGVLHIPPLLLIKHREHGPQQRPRSVLTPSPRLPGAGRGLRRGGGGASAERSPRPTAPELPRLEWRIPELIHRGATTLAG